jgi:hypothetical protein
MSVEDLRYIKVIGFKDDLIVQFKIRINATRTYTALFSAAKYGSLELAKQKALEHKDTWILDNAKTIRISPKLGVSFEYDYSAKSGKVLAHWKFTNKLFKRRFSISKHGYAKAYMRMREEALLINGSMVIPENPPDLPEALVSQLEASSSSPDLKASLYKHLKANKDKFSFMVHEHN